MPPTWDRYYLLMSLVFYDNAGSLFSNAQSHKARNNFKNIVCLHASSISACGQRMMDSVRQPPMVAKIDYQHQEVAACFLTCRLGRVARFYSWELPNKDYAPRLPDKSEVWLVELRPAS
jgi:hypothetical protein